MAETGQPRIIAVPNDETKLSQRPSHDLTTTNFDLIAACAFGLEAVVKRELAALGVDATITGSGRVRFRGDLETVAKTNLWLRVADRVLIRIAEFPAADFDALFESTRDLPWGQWLPVDASFPVTGRSAKSQLTSVPACQRAVKRAIVDAMRRDHATESLPETGGQYKIDVAILDDVATLTIDTTGRSLHRRGYRTEAAGAPLKETLAAAMILLSYWRAGRPFLDPFCGSGTLAIEAARIGHNIAPGSSRDFAFEAWQDTDAALPADLRAAAKANRIATIDERLRASDIDGSVLKAARDNAFRAGVADSIHFESQDFRRLTTKRRFGCLITNPPYGRRLRGERSAAEPSDHGRTPQQQRRDAISWELDQLYETFPDVLRKMPTWSHYVLTAYPGFERLVGRRADRRRKLYNGRIECTYFQFQGPKPVVETRDQATQTATDRSDTPTPGVESIADTPGVESTADTPGRTEPATYVHALGDAAFGHLDEKADHQAELFAARLRKRAKHLRRWPTRQGITCFRLYERDVPELPFVVDRYEDRLHITEYERPHDRDPAQHANWLELMVRTAGRTLGVPPANVYFKSRQRQRGKTQHEKRGETDDRFVVHEGGLKFLVNLADYIDTGLFLDHRITRGMIRDEADGKNFLNLFAYTGSFSVYAAAGGARKTISVDLSKSYLDWAWENMRLNEFGGNDHRFVTEDVGTFIRNHPPGEMYDLVVYDPPTFSNSKRTEQDWDVQRDAVPLLKDLLPLVRPGGVIYFSCNFRRFKFDTDEIAVTQIHEISKQTVPEDFRNRRIHRCWRIVK